MTVDQWTPEYRGRGSLFMWPLGKEVTLRCWEEPQKTARVRIESGLTTDKDAPYNKLVYEVVILSNASLPDDKGEVIQEGRRHLVRADLLEPIAA